MFGRRFRVEGPGSRSHCLRLRMLFYGVSSRACQIKVLGSYLGACLMRFNIEEPEFRASGRRRGPSSGFCDETLNPKPQTPNPKPTNPICQGPDLKPRTLPGTLQVFYGYRLRFRLHKPRPFISPNNYPLSHKGTPFI